MKTFATRTNVRRGEPMSSPLRLGLMLAAAAALGLCLLVTASAQPRAAAKYGGTLVVGLSGGEPDSLDPAVGRSFSAIVIFPSMCERLYDFDVRFRLVPVLAAAAPVLSKDKLSYTVQLRKGIKFNDGTPFDAQAVAASTQRFITLPTSTRASDFLGIASVTASGPYTVVYHLTARGSTSTPLTAALASPSGMVASPTQVAKLGANFAADPVCVGPFMFDHRVPGAHVTLVKSPWYYDQKSVFLDKIVYRPLPDAPSAAAALKAGDIQALVQVSAPEVPGIEQRSSLRVLRGPQLGFAGLYVNFGNRNGAGKPPYVNVGTPLASSAKLRQAFEEAIDRDELNRVVHDGVMQVSCTPIAPSNVSWYAAAKVPCTPYDPKHARQLVAESKIANPTVHLMVSAGTDNARRAAFIKDKAAAVGIDVVVDTFDGVTAGARAVNGDFDTYFASFGPGVPDPSFLLNAFFTASGVRNFSGYSNPRLELILANGVKATDTKARSTLYRAAQEIIASDRPIIYLYNPVTLAAFDASLAGVRLGYNGALLVANARFR